MSDDDSISIKIRSYANVVTRHHAVSTPVSDEQAAAYDVAVKMRELLDSITSEDNQQVALIYLLEGRCRTCLEVGGEWHCNDPRD